MALGTCSGQVFNESVQFQIETRQLSSGLLRSSDRRRTLTYFISRCYFAENGEKMYREL